MSRRAASRSRKAEVGAGVVTVVVAAIVAAFALTPPVEGCPINPEARRLCFHPQELTLARASPESAPVARTRVTSASRPPLGRGLRREGKADGRGDFPPAVPGPSGKSVRSDVSI